MLRFATLSLALAVAACTATAPVVDPGLPGEAVLTGTVTYRPRIALPPDAVADVQLQDVSLADAPATVLARQTVATEGRQVPIPFSLSYSPAAVQPGRRYAVRAEIRDRQGALLWTTTTAHPVFADGPEAGPVEIVLEAVESDAGVDAGSVPFDVDWRLVRFGWGEEEVMLPPGEPLSLTFREGGAYGGQAGCNAFGGTYTTAADGITLGPAAATLMMCPEPSAGGLYLTVLEGARLGAVEAESLTLVGADGARLLFAPGPDPWDEARERGASLQAVGQEPGWTLEIIPEGEIVFVADYGARRVATPDPGGEADGDRLVYHAVTESADLRVVVSPEPCEDVMSGAPYPATVEVTLDGETYRGCGRWLR